jgi:thioredoxin 1
MTTLELTEGNVDETLKGEGIVLIDWWASWCGPCRVFAPVYEAAAERHPDITFAKVDTEAQQVLAGSAGIRSIPTIMAFRDGVMVFRQAGALPDAALEDLIGQIRGLDMDEVRASITADAGAEA